jgi:metallo-beta-lactamase family protein
MIFLFLHKGMAMTSSISFLGAAQNVTGSCYMIETENSKLLIDCGMYQERDLKSRNWDPFPVTPSEVDAVLLTHAHLDHCGLLPKLVRDGFSGPIHATPATVEIARIVLADSGKIQEEDAKYKKKRHKKEGRKGKYPEIPLYTQEDAEAVSDLFEPHQYNSPFSPVPGCTAEFRDAGHILGSSMILISLDDGGEEKEILFSGDVGRWGTPILNDPTLFQSTDYAVVESTYGNRLHKPEHTIPDKLADIVTSTYKAGGNVVIPSFSIERAQELLYHLNNLLGEKRIPQMKVFLDSPMAIRVTEVFMKYPGLFDEETAELLKKGDHPCDFPTLITTRSGKESKAINEEREPCIIIAGSGMCTGGRIKHHLRRNITRPESSLLFIGYQARGTLGRILLEGTDEVRIYGKQYPVKSRIEKINGFSAHADRNELLRWLSGLESEPSCIFITHGEPEACSALADHIKEQKNWNVTVPEYLDREQLT